MTPGLRQPDARPALPFTSPLLLAPMEGVTDTAFRSLVMLRHRQEDLGGTFTEFVRVNNYPLPLAALKKHIGDFESAIPVGLQLMGQDLEALAKTAARVLELPVPLLDLNFGCPARGARKSCAGSALLDYPDRIENIVAVVVKATRGQIPVTAKIRAGVTNDRRLEEVVRAADAGGASMITVHCRTRQEGYDEAAIDWRRIARVVAATSLPVCGNGGVHSPADAERMMAETGCSYVMIGRQALGDPFCFRSQPAALAEAQSFLVDYSEAMLAKGLKERQVLSRLKQLLKYWTAAGLVQSEAQRLALLRSDALDDVLDFIRGEVGIFPI